MKTLRQGDRGAAVKTLQKALNATDAEPGLTVDGLYGQLTKRAVEDYQRSVGLYDDGIVGPRTWAALGHTREPEVWQGREVDWHGVKRIKIDQYDAGHETSYPRIRLRTDIATQVAQMRMEMLSVGACLYSSGGLRQLGARVGKNRSATSLHYLGRAIDLYVGAAMSDPTRDPYIVEPDPAHDRYWVVWARAEHGEERLLNAWVHREQRCRRVSARVINLTELLADFGFGRIGRRRSYGADNLGAAEWWHFQNEQGLVGGVTLFGEELLKVWTLEQLEGSTPWEYRDEVFGVDWN